MKRTGTVIISALAILMALSLPTDAARRRAKSAGQVGGALRVHVTDELGRPVYHAHISLHRLGTRRHARGRTNRGGNFDSRHPAAAFSIGVSHPGFLRAAATTAVRNGETTTVSVRLLRRRVLILNIHEPHRLGVLDRRGFDYRARHVDVAHPGVLRESTTGLHTK
ncbi:MAG TPA: carboxypeptidase-like regulatory domain-containing protein [Tepidisphaeraceae bacterium]|nr:carboxypeptidase-like regulatory domain-containing protein [Tepidisphaeraceae bacterium]